MNEPPETNTAAGMPRTLTARMETPSYSDPALEEVDVAYSYSSLDRLVDGAIELAMLVAVFSLFTLVLI
jgi:hypothetical protein